MSGQDTLSIDVKLGEPSVKPEVSRGEAISQQLTLW